MAKKDVKFSNDGNWEITFEAFRTNFVIYQSIGTAIGVRKKNSEGQWKYERAISISISNKYLGLLPSSHPGQFSKPCPVVHNDCKAKCMLWAVGVGVSVDASASTGLPDTDTARPNAAAKLDVRAVIGHASVMVEGQVNSINLKVEIGDFAPTDSLRYSLLGTNPTNVRYSTEVDCIILSKNDDYIEYIGGYLPDGNKWLLNTKTAIELIESGEQFYVNNANNKKVEIKVVYGDKRKYLRTESDTELNNNLLELPICSEIANSEENELPTNNLSEKWQHDGTPPLRNPKYRRYKDLSAKEIWDEISSKENNFHVILSFKKPNLNRGYFNGVVLISEKDCLLYKEELISTLGINPPDEHYDLSLIMPDGVKYPAFVFKIQNKEALEYILSLNIVDSISPFFKPMDGIGCALPKYDIKDSDRFIEENLVPWTYNHLFIEDAWALYNNILPGRPIRIGVVDTGMFEYEYQLTEPICFNHRPNRANARHFSVVSKKWDDCGHGTRIAGIACAPLDGQNIYPKVIVGIAWGAGLTTVKCTGGVLLSSGIDACNAINEAVKDGANIVNLAFGSLFEDELVHDTIIFHNENSQTIFVAAAGTNVNSVVFPAWMNEVLAVGVVRCKDYNNPGAGYEKFGLFDQSAYGSEVDIVSINDDIGMPTTGGLHHPVTLGGSSSGTAHISGILALLWGKDPNASRDVVLQRLFASCNYFKIDGSIAPGIQHLGVGRGIPDAYLACGGFRKCFIITPSIEVFPNSQYTLKAVVDGWMPVNFQWNTGEKHISAIESVVTFTAPQQSGTLTHIVTVTHPIDGKTVQKSQQIKVSGTRTRFFYSEEVVVRYATFLDGGRDDVVVNFNISMPMGCSVLSVLGQLIEVQENHYVNSGFPRQVFDDGARGFTITRPTGLSPERLDTNVHLWHDGLSAIRVRVYYQVSEPEGVDASVQGHTVE